MIQSYKRKNNRNRMVVLAVLLSAVFIAAAIFLFPRVLKNDQEVKSAGAEELNKKQAALLLEGNDEDLLAAYAVSMGYAPELEVTGDAEIDGKINRSFQILAAKVFLAQAGYRDPAAEDIQAQITPEVYRAGSRLLSIRLTAVFNLTEEDTAVRVVKTYLYLEDTKQEISAGDMFGDTVWELFADRTKSYLENSGTYTAAAEEKTVLEKIAPREENFQMVYFRSESGETQAVLLFPGGSLSESIQEDIEVAIPVRETTAFLNTEYVGLFAVSDDDTDAEDGKAPETERVIDPDKPMIALTFDDGPYSKVTNRILDVLEEYDSRATFFVLGSRLKNEQDTLKRMKEMGCDIGSHTYSHKSLVKLNKKQMQKEINSTNKLLKEYTGEEAELVRPPYGAVDDKVKKYVKYPFIMWSVDTEDWLTRNAKKTVKAVTSTVKDGDIILMHDIYESTADACEKLIPKLIKAGYQLVTVEELLQYRGVELKAGSKYYFAR
ncbi:polysaccharide deacetylase family protein [Anaerolentibacter hominis]|uniref:polysaccharide deacetylase family protein n=1 Tax=Anaerolentibacter hominis TaxID=3079009 RepID=UPI0031B8679C